MRTDLAFLAGLQSCYRNKGRFIAYPLPELKSPEKSCGLKGLGEPAFRLLGLPIAQVGCDNTRCVVHTFTR